MIRLQDLITEALTAPKEKHNPTYHQDTEVAFKKPTDSSTIATLPTAEASQKEVMERMTAVAKRAIETNIGDHNLTESQKVAGLLNMLEEFVGQEKAKLVQRGKV